jgi:hypothetical protein
VRIPPAPGNLRRPAVVDNPVRRIALATFLAALVLSPAAAAKGPHASVSPAPSGVEPGRPWVATLTLLEYGRRQVAAARPTVILRSGDDTLTVVPKRLGTHVPRFENVLAEARYRLRVAFPREGRWSFTVLDGTPANLRFRFPRVRVGGSSEGVTRDYVAFPAGSPEEAPVRGGPLPPQVVSVPADESDGGGAGLWILAGLPLACAGILALRERRRRTS